MRSSVARNIGPALQGRPVWAVTPLVNASSHAEPHRRRSLGGRGRRPASAPATPTCSAGGPPPASPLDPSPASPSWLLWISVTLWRSGSEEEEIELNIEVEVEVGTSALVT